MIGDSMEKDGWKLIGICGIYCGDCPSYLAHQTNDIEELKLRAQRTGFTLEEVRCDGCHSENLMPTCIECRHGFRQCAKEHRVRWCFECSDFPCQRLEDFKDIHVENGISHHKHLVDELYYLRENGIEDWLTKKEREGCCPQCGKKVYWCTRTCPDGGTGIR